MTLDQLHALLKPYYRSPVRSAPLRLASVAEVRSEKGHPLRESLVYLPDDLQLLTFAYPVRVLQYRRWTLMADWAAADAALRQHGYCIRPLDFDHNALLLWPVEREAIHFNNHNWVVTAYGRDIPQFGPFSARLAIANAYRELFPLAKPLLLIYNPRSRLFFSMFLWDEGISDMRGVSGRYVPRELSEEKLCKLFNRSLLDTRRRSPRYWQELALKIL